MRLNKEFLIHVTEKESVLVPTGKADFSGIVRGNKTLGYLLNLLKEEVTEEELVRAMKEHFDAPEGMIEGDVEKTLSELRKIGAIDE